MKYLLVTMHNKPKFYKANGEVVELELNYVESKTFGETDGAGRIYFTKIGGNSAVVQNHWMVDSIEQSLKELNAHDIYPYKSKVLAKENAIRLGLKSFKYIPVS